MSVVVVVVILRRQVVVGVLLLLALLWLLLWLRLLRLALALLRLRLALLSARRDAVALHFLVAKLFDDGCGDEFGDDVELAVFQALVNYEADERVPVHDQPFLGGLGVEVRLGLAGERGVVSEQARIVVGIHEHRVQGGRVLLPGADHRFATHLLFGFFSYLDRGNGGVRHIAGCTFEGVLHLSLELRENTHCYSFFAAFERVVSLIVRGYMHYPAFWACFSRYCVPTAINPQVTGC